MSDLGSAISSALGERVAALAAESATALRAVEAVEAAAAAIEANLSLLDHEISRQKRVANDRAEREAAAMRAREAAKAQQRDKAVSRIARRAELEAQLKKGPKS